MVLAVLLSAALSVPPALAAPESGSAAETAALLTYRAGSDLEYTAEVRSQTVDGQLYLFLPSSADLENLVLTFSGDRCTVKANGKTLSVRSGAAFDFQSLFPSVPADGRYDAKFIISGITYRVCVMRSGGIRSLYISSSDPDKNHAYVDAKKGNKAKNNEFVLLTASGECVYEGIMKEIKGRGNSTWTYPKKPYQIKLKEKVDLLGNGSGEAAKTWVLLANYADDAMFRNTLTNDLAAALELNYAHNCEFADLYYDGEYCGTYLLSEKTEIDEARVNIRDLEQEIEDANSDVELDDLQTAVIENESGDPMQIVEGVTLPADYTGGYLLELDYESRAKAEKCWFKTTNGQYVVCKSPEYLPAEGMEYISGLFQDFEDAVYNGGIHPETGKSYTEYVDLTSLAQSYLLLTISQNSDAFLSSTFFYIPENDQKLYAGPVWDFDTAYGLYFNSDATGFLPARSKLVQRLLQIDSFREAVTAQWTDGLREIIRDTVLSESAQAASGSVRSIAGYGAACMRSQQMDALRWGRTGSYSEALDALYAFMQESFDWVEQVLTSPEPAWSASGFYDIEKDIWYEDAVIYVTGQGYFSGISDVLFSPNTQMTRSMLVTVLYRMAGSPAVTGSCSYSDVSPEAWYADAVIWAEETGITKGRSDGTFGAAEAVSREELIVFLYRFALQSDPELSPAELPAGYTDIAQVSPWAKEAFGWAVSRGIITGTDSDETPSLLPQRTASRVETAVILFRYDRSGAPA